MMDPTNYLALQVKPLDVATPLLMASRIKQQQAETQQQTVNMQRDAIGAEARGLAAYVGQPDYAERVQSAKQRLTDQGVIGSPQAAAGFDRDFGSPMGLQSIIARTQSPQLALQEKQFSESSRHNKALESQSAASLAETRHQHEMENLKPVQIGESLSGPIYGIRNPKTPGGYDVIDARALRSTQQGGAAPGQPNDGQAGDAPPGATPQPGVPAPARGGPTAADLASDAKAGRNVKYLQTLDPDEQQLIRKVADYDINPQSLSTKGGKRERVLTAAANFDPSYDQKNYTAYSAGLKSFGTSKEGTAVRAFNVGIEHIDQLMELGSALNNGNIPKINELRNWFRKNVGEDAPTNFEGLKSIVGAEIVKAIVGAGGTGEERAQAAKTVAAASSPQQLEGIAKTYKNAMGAQLGGLQRQYEQSTGRKDFDRLLSPYAIKARDAHNSAGSAANATPEVSEARAAIAKGAPRDAVEKRLKEKGVKYNPGDLD